MMIHSVVSHVLIGADDLCDGSKGQVSANSNRWVDTPTKIKSGMRTAPPPTPVRPTSVPTKNPRLIKTGSNKRCPLSSKKTGRSLFD